MTALFASKDKQAAPTLRAIANSQAIIEFELDGTIRDANQNFLAAMGYSLEEIKGKHHRIFVDAAYANTADYKEFWAKLARGEHDAREYKRFGKGGKEIWIQASYNPVFDNAGRPVKVVKIATDITGQQLKNADYSGQLSAIDKSQAVIQFDLDGNILAANGNFLAAVGYSLEEIKGKHHRMFADPVYAQSVEYKEFWAKLRRGEYDAGEYKRFGKGGKEIWIQASYNPILDMNGRPFKIVKYATDITQRKLQAADYQGQLDAISKSQAVIQFNMDGTILEANANFLNAVGYSLEEIKGRHHRMFVEPAEAQSPEYAQFWESLREGKFDARVYKRFGKGGKEIWIQASYNPIFDMSGKPFKVVKYATDVTELMATVGLADATDKNVQSVAAATEEMSASIGEISKNMALSKKATDDIVSRTTTSGEASERLITTMQSMENIVNMIREIAGQVNMLALNATIEAARAGEAGKGFAVVASEVKNLASQASKATDEIATQISLVQGISGEVAGSIGAIVETASAVDQYVNTVASAIEEQTAVMREISSNTGKTSTAVAEISGRIRKMSQ